MPAWQAPFQIRAPERRASLAPRREPPIMPWNMPTVQTYDLHVPDKQTEGGFFVGTYVVYLAYLIVQRT